MTAEELFLRRVVVSGFAFIYWAGVLIQARRVRKKIRRSPNLKPRGTKEKVLWLGWLLVIVIWMTQSLLIGKVPGSQFIDALLSRTGLVAGAFLTVAGYASTLWCYAAMGDAWRIGINTGERNPLVSRGPYRFVRHPIYLFQIVMLAGGVLLLPTILSCVILLIHLLCVLIKAMDEESYLLSVHGQPYRDYLARTGRLVPRLFGRRTRAA
jgi:protein-S-isoprenylcysteine O-methyltransferase Ste14